jgi:membrane protease YdiL (CAAX protease family)
MKHKSFWYYYLLTFLLLGLIPILALIFNDGSMNFDQAVTKATKGTGLEWTSNLLVMIRLILAEPLLLLIVLGSAAPALAAILTLVFLTKENKWKIFFGRLNPLKSLEWSLGLKIYGQIFLLLIFCLFTIFALRQVTDGNYAWPDDLISLNLIPAILVIAFLDQGAVLEELGWRGFATPELQNGGMNPLKVAILIGICWGLWHFPRDVTTGVIERLGLFSYLILYLPSFLLGTVSVSIIASYFMNKVGGSIIPAIIIHGITNDAIGLSGTASIVDALTPYHQITRAIPYTLVAIALLSYSGFNLNWNKSSES